MPAIDYNFIVEQGSDFQINYQYNDANNNPIDLSTKCVTLQIKPANLDYVYTFSSKQPVTYDTYGFSLTATDKGLITFKLSAQYTNNEFTFNTAVYDLDIISDNSNILQNVRLAGGIITVKKRNISLLSVCPGGDNPKQPLFLSTSGSPSTPSPTPTITSSGLIEDLCLATDCLNTDIYSIVYAGSGMNIPDMGSCSGSIEVTDTRIIENIELVVSKLNHTNPQDLQLFLSAPSGDTILLAGNHKITNYSNNFSFMFSNKAQPTSYLHNVTNGGLCNIYNKTNSINYSNQPLMSSFNHLFGYSVTGLWTFTIRDTDPLSSGLIDGWKLIITYLP